MYMSIVQEQILQINRKFMNKFKCLENITQDIQMELKQFFKVVTSQNIQSLPDQQMEQTFWQEIAD